MAGVFLLLSLAMIAIFFEYRPLAIFLLSLVLVCAAVIFWYHVTDAIPINL